MIIDGCPVLCPGKLRGFSPISNHRKNKLLSELCMDIWISTYTSSQCPLSFWFLLEGIRESWAELCHIDMLQINPLGWAHSFRSKKLSFESTVTKKNNIKILKKLNLKWKKLTWQNNSLKITPKHTLKYVPTWQQRKKTAINTRQQTIKTTTNYTYIPGTGLANIGHDTTNYTYIIKYAIRTTLLKGILRL